MKFQLTMFEVAFLLFILALGTLDLTLLLFGLGPEPLAIAAVSALIFVGFAVFDPYSELGCCLGLLLSLVGFPVPLAIAIIVTANDFGSVATYLLLSLALCIRTACLVLGIIYYLRDDHVDAAATGSRLGGEKEDKNE